VPRLVSLTLAFALQLRKKHGKTSVRVVTGLLGQEHHAWLVFQLEKFAIMEVPCDSYRKDFCIFYETVECCLRNELCAVKEHMPAVIFLLMFHKSCDNWVSVTTACHILRL